MYQSNQEVFDVVAKHLLTQGVKSMTDLPGYKPICAYRGKNGTKCAVGVLLPDDKYNPDMEGVTLNGTLIRKVLTEALGCEVNTLLLEQLQEVHDKSEPDMWKQNLLNTAGMYGLDPAVVNTHV